MSVARTPFGPQVFTPADAAVDQRVRESFARLRAPLIDSLAHRKNNLKLLFGERPAA